MRKKSHLRRNRRGTLVRLLVTASLVSTTLSSPMALPAHASSVRSAIVSEVTGTVTYKKSGGSRSNTVYQDLTLNEGDSISTGSGAYAVLKIADRDDLITIDQNTEVYISELVEIDGAKKSKLKMWAGSLWSKVKSLVASSDEVEVATPTAVMGVRGTHFYTYVNPLTGQELMLVASGRVHVNTITATELMDTQGAVISPSESGKSVMVYPAQQVTLDKGQEVQDLKTKVEYVDINELVSVASPAVLGKIIENVPDILQENEKVKEQLKQKFEQGAQKPDPNAALFIPTDEVLKKIQSNIDAFLPNVAKQAVEQKKVTEQQIQNTNAKIAEAQKKLDLNNVPKLDPNAGKDPAAGKPVSKPAVQVGAGKEAEENRKAAPQQAIEQAKASTTSKAAENTKVETKLVQTAEQTLLNSYTASQQQQFNKAKTDNTAANPQPVQVPNSSGGGSSGEVPAKPELVSTAVTKALVNQEVELKLKAAAGTTVSVKKAGSTESPQSAAVVDGTATIKVKFSQRGTYTLHAYTTNSNGSSESISLPAIQVYEPAVKAVQAGPRSGSEVRLQLDIQDIVDGTTLNEKSFYAVEVHLLYDKTKLTYNGPKALPDNDGTLFDGANGAEVVRQDSGATQSELTYAGSLFQSSTSNPASEISLNGAKKTLAYIPLTVTTTDPSAEVTVAYVKVLDKAGDILFESSNSQKLTVSLTN
ncbi:FecR domain-containing protein [Paenibacillus sp. YYML68]|uniref:FecR domain-containing protein n=1 Tax=Paenibacillus sp. YYML68 TaxID=2909250 RepID=UPI002490738D|nr:FecR domain-containing protein [Paenibacillus sp. YYML68]